MSDLAESGHSPRSVDMTGRRQKRTSRRKDMFVPEQLYLIRKLGVGERPDRSKHKTMSCIEHTRRDVDVLGLHLDLAVSALSGPALDRAKQNGTDSLVANFGGDTDVPQNCKIASPLRHGCRSRVGSDDGAANTTA